MYHFWEMGWDIDLADEVGATVEMQWHRHWQRNICGYKWSQYVAHLSGEVCAIVVDCGYIDGHWQTW